MTPKSFRSIDVFVISMYINKGLDIFFFRIWKTNLENFLKSRWCVENMPTTLHVTNTAQKSLHKILCGLTLIHTHWGLQIYWFNRNNYICVYFSGHACLYTEILNEALTVSILKNPWFICSSKKKIK